MKQGTAKKFIDDNKEALLALSDLVRQTELCATDGEQYMVRKHARLLVEKWISDTFNIAYTVDEIPTQEPSIFRRLDRERQEGRTDAY